MHEGKYLVKIVQDLVLNKKNSLILLVIAVVFLIYSYLNLNLGFNKSYFHFIYIDYLNIYLQSCISLVIILNSLFISLLVINDLKLENKMLMVMIIKEIGVKRFESKRIIVIMKVVYLLTSFEYIIILGMPLVFYPSFPFNINFLLIYIYIWLITLSAYVLSYILIGVFKSIYVVCIPVLLIITMMLVEGKISSYVVFSFDYQSKPSSYIALFVTLLSVLITEFSVAKVMDSYYYK